MSVTEVLRYFKRVIPHLYQGLKIFYPKYGGDMIAVAEKLQYPMYDQGDLPYENPHLYYGRPQIGWSATLHGVLSSMPFGMLASMCERTAYWNWDTNTDRRQIATWLIEHKFQSMYQQAANRHAHVHSIDGSMTAVDTLKYDVGQIDRQIIHYIEQFVEEIDWRLDDLPGIVYGRNLSVGTDSTKSNPVVSCQYYFAEKRK